MKTIMTEKSFKIIKAFLKNSSMSSYDIGKLTGYSSETINRMKKFNKWINYVDYKRNIKTELRQNYYEQKINNTSNFDELMYYSVKFCLKELLQILSVKVDTAEKLNDIDKLKELQNKFDLFNKILVNLEDSWRKKKQINPTCYVGDQKLNSFISYKI